MTYVPYYDGTLTSRQKNMLGSVLMAHSIEAKVQTLEQKTHDVNSGDTSDKKLVD